MRAAARAPVSPSDAATPPGQATAVAPAISSARAAAYQRRDSGGRWFYWIAGLSLLNAALFAVGSSWGFAIGTAIGFYLQGIFMALFEPGLSWFAHPPVVLLFAWFGREALRGKRWAFVAGGLLYGLDAMLVLLDADWLSLPVHAFAVVAIVNGLRAQGELERPDGPVVSPAV